MQCTARCSQRVAQRKGNVPHVARNMWLSGKAMYRTVLATCGSAKRQCTARCSQRVAQRKGNIRIPWTLVYREGDRFSLSAEPHVASNVRYIALAMKPRGITPFRLETYACWAYNSGSSFSQSVKEFGS